MFCSLCFVYPTRARGGSIGVTSSGCASFEQDAFLKLISLELLEGHEPEQNLTVFVTCVEDTATIEVRRENGTKQDRSVPVPVNQDFARTLAICVAQLIEALEVAPAGAEQPETLPRPNSDQTDEPKSTTLRAYSIAAGARCRGLNLNHRFFSAHLRARYTIRLSRRWGLPLGVGFETGQASLELGRMVEFLWAIGAGLRFALLSAGSFSVQTGPFMALALVHLRGLSTEDSVNEGDITGLTGQGAWELEAAWAFRFATLFWELQGGYTAENPQGRVSDAPKATAGGFWAGATAGVAF